MTAEEYTANFEMISGRTGFNDATLEDAYVRGLPSPSFSRSTPRPPFHPRHG